jgi:hypothetical protein
VQINVETSVNAAIGADDSRSSRSMELKVVTFERPTQHGAGFGEAGERTSPAWVDTNALRIKIE